MRPVGTFIFKLMLYNSVGCKNYSIQGILGKSHVKFPSVDAFTIWTDSPFWGTFNSGKFLS